MGRIFRRFGIGVALAAVGYASLAAQQTSRAGAPDAVQAFIASRMRSGWIAPKTPWGHPDIQGTFTTKDEANTPFERPDEWAGRTITDITSTELEAAIIKRQERAIERAPFAGGGDAEQGVAIAVPIHWFDNLAAKNSRPWFLIDPPDGRVPAMTPDAAAHAIPLRPPNGDPALSYATRDLADRCIVFSTGGPWQLPAIYGNSYEILQHKDYVVMRYEMVHEARIIPLDGRPHVSPKIRSYFGDSRGHWEGNTLVVETTNFNENLEYRDFPIFNQRLKAGGGAMTHLKMIERFTRISRNQVEWTTTVEDPTVWPRPWTYSFPLTQDDKQRIFEYACHEGNYGMANILSAEREKERKAR